MKKIKCPLVDKLVNDGFCFDTSIVAERIAPERTLPEEVKSIKNFREICLKCPNHKD